MNRSRATTTPRWSSRVRGSQPWRRWLDRLSSSHRRRTGPLVGTDLGQPRRRSAGWQRAATPLVVLGLAAALILTTLRTDIMRMQYDLAEAGEQELELLDLQRRLTVKHRQLLAPSRLKILARERGFTRPGRVIVLADETSRAGGRW